MSTVEHKGIVKRIKGRDIEVEFCRSSACGNCESSGFCGVESASQSVWVKDSVAMAEVGEEVTVVMAESAGLIAVLWGYVIPLIVFFVALITLKSLLRHEGLAGVLALLMLGPYYAVLWLLRGRMKKTFSFHLKR